MMERKKCYSSHLLSMTPFDLHKALINQYVLTRKGTTALLKRDTSRDKRDIDVIRENHQFLWDEHSEPDSWEKRLAKKYYDKLFKEYCICDLSRFRENKVAMRWQTEQELVSGEGQFICGEKNCKESEGLRTWEVNFGYVEQGEKKNALVKLRLCPECSYKLNYKHQRKEIRKKSKKRSIQINDPEDVYAKKHKVDENKPTEADETPSASAEKQEDGNNIWKTSTPILEEKPREEEFEEYLSHLFL